MRGEPMRDAETYWSNVVFPDKGNGVLGYELATQSTGTVTRGDMGGQMAAPPARQRGAARVRVGDRLVPVEAQPYDLQFIPHPPAGQEYGRPAGHGGLGH